jgi:predicted acylesterase/phospholipase RssA
MIPFRKNVALAIDGGGIRGVIATRALAILEEQLGRPSRAIFGLTAGTSTGSIVSAGIGAGLTGAQMTQLYQELGNDIFRKTLRSRLWIITKYRYPHEPLESALRQHIGDLKMADFWSATPPIDVLITCFDMEEDRTRFIKPWKPEYADWPVTRAVLASSSVPTFFPPVEGRYVDGGIGSYANPCYPTAYELKFCLGWDLRDTTLISLGTGVGRHEFDPRQAKGMWPWQWLGPIMGAFLKSADDEQVHLVDELFPGLDFRRFQVQMDQDIGMDEPEQMPQLLKYGDELGRKILNDEMEAPPSLIAAPIPM